MTREIAHQKSFEKALHSFSYRGGGLGAQHAQTSCRLGAGAPQAVRPRLERLSDRRDPPTAMSTSSQYQRVRCSERRHSIVSLTIHHECSWDSASGSVLAVAPVRPSMNRAIGRHVSPRARRRSDPRLSCCAQALYTRLGGSVARRPHHGCIRPRAGAGEGGSKTRIRAASEVASSLPSANSPVSL